MESIAIWAAYFIYGWMHNASWMGMIGYFLKFHGIAFVLVIFMVGITSIFDRIII